MTRTSVLLAASLTTLAACTVKPAQGSEAAGRSPPATASTPPSSRADAHDVAAAELVAQIEGAVQTWRDSCPTPNAQGLCIEHAVADPSPQRCAVPVLGRVIVHPRDPALASSALAELASAMDRAGCDDNESRQGCDPEVLDVQPRDAALRHRFHHALAAARLCRADAELEAYFALTMPTDIDFVVEEWKRDSREPGHAEEYRAQVTKRDDSQQRFKTYFESKTELAASLTADLAAVKQYRDEEVLARAALRTSWTALHFYDELHSAEIPASARTEPHREAYCAMLDDFGSTARRNAREAAYYCTRRAAQDGYRSPTVDACHELLARLEP
jgi:hypothetical protein